MKITVIRLGHRIGRDLRTTTHVALTARALGAKEAILCGEHEPQIEKTVQEIVKRWGGTFQIHHAKNPKQALREKQKQKYCLIHATMYGEPILKIIRKLRKHAKIAIIVGSEKVPREIYEMADYNVAVTHQPHSETAALAILLHELQNGKELNQKFSKAKLKIIGQARGKKVQNKKTKLTTRV